MVLVQLSWLHLLWNYQWKYGWVRLIELWFGIMFMTIYLELDRGMVSWIPWLLIDEIGTRIALSGWTPSWKVFALEYYADISHGFSNDYYSSISNVSGIKNISKRLLFCKLASLLLISHFESKERKMSQRYHKYGKLLKKSIRLTYFRLSD